MIWDLVKGLVKFGFLLGAGFVILIWWFSTGGTNVDNEEDTELPFQNVTYMMTSYEKNAEAQRGTWCQCPVCDNYYYKENYPCCSYKCEKEYHELVRAWHSSNSSAKQYIEKHGKKFR